jgi:hypothetical protein
MIHLSDLFYPETADILVVLHGPGGILARMEGSQDDVGARLTHDLTDETLRQVTRVEIMPLREEPPIPIDEGYTMPPTWEPLFMSEEEGKGITE